MREYLLTLRKARNLTQQQLAKKLDISPCYYNQIEKGERQKNMDISIVSKLSTIFNVSVNQIIEFEKQWFQNSNVVTERTSD